MAEERVQRRLGDFAHMVLGNIHLYLERDISAAIREAERSLELNPNYALAMATLGLAMIFADQPEEGVGHCLRAVEANPRFPANNWFMEYVSLGHFMRGDHSASIDWARRADQRQRDVPRCLLTLITSCWHTGQPDMAGKEAKRLLHAYPDFCMRDLRSWPFQNPEHWDRFTRGLREVGLPE